MSTDAQASTSWGSGDWSIVCDNTNHCEAAATSDGQGADGMTKAVEASLRISRDAGPNTAIVARLFIEDDPGPFQLRVAAGTPIHTAPHQDLPVAAFAELLPELLRASAASVAVTSGVYRLPLLGLKAVLLKMDDLQGRIGTPGALVAKGNRSEMSVPAPHPAPVVHLARLPPSKAGDSALAVTLQERMSQSCESADDNRLGASVQTLRLSDSQVALLFACGTPLYNQAFDIWLVDDSPPYHAIPLKIPSDNGDNEMPVLTNAIFERGLLSATFYGNGRRECWSQSWWGWTGTQFDLIKVEGADCPGAQGVTLRTWTATLTGATGDGPLKVGEAKNPH
jgi:hypothetical protein